MLLSRGLRYMVIGAFFFSLMSLLVKLAGERLPSSQIVLARAAVSVVLSWVMLRRARIDPWGTRRGLLLLRGLLGFGALSCFYFALVNLPLAEATVIQYTNPVFVALLAGWFLGERLGRREVGCVAAGLAGVVLIARPEFLFGGAVSTLDPWAVSVALAGALFSAAAYVTIRALGQSEDPLVIVFYFPLVTVPAVLAFVVPVALWPTPAEWLLLLGVGVSTQVAQVYMTRGLQIERAGRATAVGYVQIVFAAVWGMAFFGDVPDLWLFGGTALVLAGTFLLVERRRGEE